MCSNPTFEWPPTFLTSQQAIVAEMHHAAAVTDAEAALGAVVSASPRRSSLELVPRSSVSLSSFLGTLDLYYFLNLKASYNFPSNIAQYMKKGDCNVYRP